MTPLAMRHYWAGLLFVVAGWVTLDLVIDIPPMLVIGLTLVYVGMRLMVEWLVDHLKENLRKEQNERAQRAFEETYGQGGHYEQGQPILLVERHGMKDYER